MERWEKKGWGTDRCCFWKAFFWGCLPIIYVWRVYIYMCVSCIYICMYTYFCYLSTDLFIYSIYIYIINVIHNGFCFFYIFKY
jgi:hypothetical protein